MPKRVSKPKRKKAPPTKQQLELERLADDLVLQAYVNAVCDLEAERVYGGAPGGGKSFFRQFNR